MDMTGKDTLQQAMELARAGETKQAGAILAAHLRREPRDARAWLLLSYTLDEPERQLYALRRVLAIDPGNRVAAAELDRRTGAAAAVAGPSAPPPTPSPARLPARRARVRISPSLVAGILMVSILALAALAAPLIAPTPEGESSGIIPRYGASPRPTPPSAEHPLGLLPKQYDVLYGLVWGGRRAFAASLLVTAGRLLLGVALGLLSGYAGGWLDGLLMRLTDGFLAFPIMAAAMVMVSLYGVELVTTPYGTALAPDRQESIVVAALMIFGWMSYARLIRGNLLAEREKEYIQAARAVGLRPARIALRHLLPNASEGLFVMAASDIGAVVVLLATFAFLGFFASPFGFMEADWGQMLSAARDWIINPSGGAFKYWYTFLPVSAAIIFFSLGWNLIGDSLRDTLDPYLR